MRVRATGLVSMATPGDLVKAVAAALGLPAATVALHDRRLAEGGLRSMNGRGRSASLVTATDAARLLTSLMASRTASDAAATVTDYMRTKELSAPGRAFSAVKVGGLRGLTADHSFIDALAALIAAAGTREMEEVFGLTTLDGPDAAAAIRIEAKSPIVFGQIALVLPPGKGAGRKVGMSLYVDAASDPDRDKPAMEWAGRIDDGRAIFAIGKVVGGQG